MVAYLVRVETEKAGGFRERPIFGPHENNQKLFVEKVSRLSLKTIHPKYQKEHVTNLMYPTKTAILWSKTGVGC